MAKEPEEIEDVEHEQIVDRVAAIDVAKASGMVCIRVPNSSRPGRRVSRVQEVPATTNAIIELGEQLVAERIEKVTVESTSDYWRGWFYLLEAAGLQVALVNARDVKNAPGRPKTDKLDSVWLAKLTERGMLRPSFVPQSEIRQLRDYTRMHTDLTRDRTRHWQRLEKLLEDALIKISSVRCRADVLAGELAINTEIGTPAMTTTEELCIGVDLSTDVATSEARVREALATEGFGILTEIDVQATLHDKLGIDMPSYKILGACNPNLAHRAISADPLVGLLLPCNVVVRAVGQGTRVEFADPLRMLDLIDNPVLHQVAVDARERLIRVAAALDPAAAAS